MCYYITSRTNINVTYLPTEIVPVSKPNCLLWIVCPILFIAAHGYIVCQAGGRALSLSLSGVT